LTHFPFKLERELTQTQARIASQPAANSTPPENNDMKTEISKLKEENKNLAEQLEVYELRKDQMHIQVNILQNVCTFGLV